MLEEVYAQTKDHMEKSIDSLKKDYKSLRTGKVNPNILDGIRIDYYGTPTELGQVGSVLSPDATTIVINPWEKNLLKDKAITDDESKKAQDEIQKITDSYVVKADETLKAKEKDILTV